MSQLVFIIGACVIDTNAHVCPVNTACTYSQQRVSLSQHKY